MQMSRELLKRKRSTMRVTALVPMRHESERVPGKNYRPFNGKPLCHYVLEMLQDVPQVERIVVDTDSPVIRSYCSLTFPDIVCLDRPKELCGGEVPMTEILRYDTQEFPSEWYLQTHSTNPLLEARTVERAISHLSEALGDRDSLVSVSRLQARLFDSAGEPLNHDPLELKRTQDLSPVFVENSNLYVFNHDQSAAGRRFGRRPLFFELDPRESIDIDEEDDFVFAEEIHQIRHAER